jgi:hypothetical protein
MTTVRDGETIGTLGQLFIGFHPDDVFFRLVSVDMAELMIVFGFIVITMGVMVAFGNWWSR